MLSLSPVSPEFKERRERLMSHEPDACFLFFGAEVQTRNESATYPFRQDSNFSYFSGFLEASSIMILAAGKSYLFVLPRDPEKETWDGERYGPERAKEVFGFDEVYVVSEWEKKLEEFLSLSSKLCFRLEGKRGRLMAISNILDRVSKRRGRGKLSLPSIVDPTQWIAQMRLVKSENEIQIMARSAANTVKAHEHLLMTVRPGMNEKHAEHEFRYALSKVGSFEMAYEPIFASGMGATFLHYVENNRTLMDGDLLLVDAGGELEGYASDLTQTFPVGKAFSAEQRQVYEGVLSIHHQIIKKVKIGLPFRELQDQTLRLTCQLLRDLGVTDESVDTQLETKSFRKYYPHGVSHYLGRDVHDWGVYDENKVDQRLIENMVLTIEPGLYFRNSGTRFEGIGVRIEDDVVVTSSGPKVLTQDLVRTIFEIEALRRQAY